MAFQQFPSKGGIPSGNTAGRPSGPVIGDTYYNGQLEILEIYNGTAWVAISAPPAVPTISSVTDVGTGLAYASGGTFTVVVAPGTGGATALQYNVVTDSGGFTASSTSTTISLTGLTPATSFAVSANAQNNFGTTVNSSPFASVVATTVPQAPTIGTATASTTSNEVTTTWTLGSNGGKNLSAITITPYLNGTTAQTSRTAATTSSTSYVFTDGQLTQGSSYTFKVKTTNANGDSLESSATNSATVPNFITVDYLVIAGGGGGGCNSANGNQNTGGGGAGGYRTSAGTSGAGSSAEATLALTGSTTYSVVIGSGGSGASGNNRGGAGGNSTFSTITSTGGGGGGGQDQGPATGGSGGGGSTGTTAGAVGTTSQGRAGGNSGDYASRGGGGGGSSTAGANGTGTAAGGDGTASDITGTSVTRAGGGGGGKSNGAAPNDTPGAGGSGGGGSGAGGNGTANTGSGGGGGYGNVAGGSGGAGVVILRYPEARTITIGAGLTGTESAASGGYKRATITAGSGNVSW
jgi:hypothetical protein